MMEKGQKSKAASKPSDNLRNLTLTGYLTSELKRGYLLENDEERYAKRREKVYTFFMIPRETEKFFAYGYFQCADSFTFVMTFLPLRFLMACWTLVTRGFAMLFRRKNPQERLLRPAEVVDLVKGVLLLSCCYVMTFIDTSMLYHVIKTQSTIKLYIFFNMLDIADRLMSAFGQDTLDALFWTATEPGGRKRERVGGMIFHLAVALTSVFIHATIVLLQSLALNVAINADNKGLLTILISNNFVELKSSVLKKTDRLNLLQVSCSDVRERFHLSVLMGLVAVQTLKEYSWSEERLYILLPDCLLVLGTEVLVDWIKHAFMTRCNDIPIEAYREYTTILAHDLIMCKQKYADSDHSDLVARRMGFMPLPLGVVTFRILSQSLPLHNFTAFTLLGLALAAIITFRVLNGIIMLGKACDIIEEAERRKAQADAASDAVASAAKPNPRPDETTGKASSSSNESTLNGDLTGTDALPVSSSPNSKKSCCCCCRERATQLSTTTPVRKTDEEDGLAYLTPLRNSTCYNYSTPAETFEPRMPQSLFYNTEDGGSVPIFTTPFDTPTHLVKRDKGKRVRLDSGAMVQEIEPYYPLLVDEESPEKTQNGEKSKPKSALHLDLSTLSKSSEEPLASSTSSPKPYDDSSSMSFGLNSQEGLMANSMVDLASVGLNEGPHSPLIGNTCSFSRNSSSHSLPRQSSEEDPEPQNISEATKPSPEAASATADHPVAADAPASEQDKKQGPKTAPAVTDREKSHHCASDGISESNLVHSFKAVSAPDVRIPPHSDDEDYGKP